VLVSTQTPGRLTPRDQIKKTKAKRIVYLVNAGGVYARANHRRAVAELGAQFPDNHDMLATLRRGVEHLLSDPADAVSLAECLGVVDLYTTHIDALEEAMRMRAAGAAEDEILAKLQEHAIAPDLKDRIEQLELVVARGYSPFAAKNAARDFFMAVSPVEAFRQFVVGVENAPFDFRTGPGGVPDDVLENVPEHHRVEIGFAALDLMSVNKAEEKNLKSPSPGTSSPKSSATAKRGPNRTQRRTAKAGASKKSASKDLPSTPST